MRSGFLRNFSFSFLQLVLNQGLSFVVFLFLSRCLDKAAFGTLNLSLAVLLMAYSVLSFGLDQLLVRKIAAGGDARSLVGMYLFHAAAAGLIFYLLLLFCWMFFPGMHDMGWPLVVLGAGKYFFYLSLPFKSAAAGREQFRTLLLMSVPASCIKALGTVLLFAGGRLSFAGVLAVFAAGDVAELLICILLAKRLNVLPKRLQTFFKHYKYLIREALPQSGVVIFSLALARFDQVVLHAFTGPVPVAEYSFAVRACEIATLPLLAIGPLLLPLASRTHQQGEHPELRRLLRLELLLAAITVLLLNLLWVPVVDPLTEGKYGQANITTILFLSGTIPLLYLNNYLWTLQFSRGRLHAIFWIFAASSILNLAADLLLIPAWGAAGAALAYLLSLAFQSALYLYQEATQRNLHFLRIFSSPKSK